MALATWRKWLMGLRVIRRVKEEYGHDFEAHIKESTNPFTNQKKTAQRSQHHHDFQDSKGRHATPTDERSGTQNFSSNEDDHLGGGFIVENGEAEANPQEGQPILKGRSRSKEATQQPVSIARELRDATSTDEAQDTVEISPNGIFGSEPMQDNAETGPKRGRKRKAATANEREMKSRRATLAHHSARDDKSQFSTHILDSLLERKTRETRKISTMSSENHEHDSSKQVSWGRSGLRSTPQRSTRARATLE